MKKDIFSGHSVKRPIVTVLGKYMRRRSSRALRRMPVEPDEIASTDRWYRQLDSRVNRVKLIGFDNPGESFGHCYTSAKDNYGRESWVLEDNQKIETYEGNRRIKITRSGHFFVK